MSDSGEIEVEAIQGYQVLPKDVTAEIGSIKLFNKWVRKPDDLSSRIPGARNNGADGIFTGLR